MPVNYCPFSNDDPISLVIYFCFSKQPANLFPVQQLNISINLTRLLKYRFIEIFVSAKNIL